MAGGKVIELDVQELLNGVDLDGTRPEKRERTHLQLLQPQGFIEAWHDRKIEAGEEWKRKINENLERAGLILLLVSADFMASDYCYEIEMKRAPVEMRKESGWIV